MYHSFAKVTLTYDTFLLQLVTVEHSFNCYIKNGFPHCITPQIPVYNFYSLWKFIMCSRQTAGCLLTSTITSQLEQNLKSFLFIYSID